MICSSWAWPNIFDAARSKVSLYNDSKSITNRVKLLMLTDPAELYMTPNFGLGLKKFLFRYQNDNAIAMIKDALIEQLRLWEPSVIPEQTEVTRGLNSSSTTGNVALSEAPNKLNLTVVLKTKYGQTLTLSLTENDLASATT